MNLPLRLFVVNFGVVCVLVWTWWIGLAGMVVAADTVHMGAFIAGIFALNMVSVFQQARIIGKVQTYRASQRARILMGGFATTVFVLFTLGIIGTGLGLIVGFHDISFGTTAEAAQKFGAQVIAGVTSTFGATVVGATCGAWLEINSRMLNTALSLLELELDD